MRAFLAGFSSQLGSRCIAGAFSWRPGAAICTTIAPASASKCCTYTFSLDGGEDSYSSSTSKLSTDARDVLRVGGERDGVRETERVDEAGVA